MRYFMGLVCVLALGVMPLVGCGETNGDGGEGGTGGMTGQVFPCTEQGIRDAIAEGGGPHFFACDGPTTVVTEAEIVIDDDVTLDGEGNLTVDGAEDHRVFSVDEGVTAELRGLTATRGNSGTEGGGIYNAGTLTLTNSTVSGNTAGGVERGNGGGILNFFGSGTLTLKNSTVSGNTASFSGGGITNGRDLVLIDSTVSGNAAPSGAGISSFGPLTLMNSTVSGNSAGGFGGGAIFNDGGTLTLTNSMVDGDCGSRSGPSPVTSNGYNIESPGNTCGLDQPTDQVDVGAEDLNLGPLADNDGPTETQALLSGSVAIDVIPADMCEVDEDQRGEPRDSMCDVGAFEVQP